MNIYEFVINDKIKGLGNCIFAYGKTAKEARYKLLSKGEVEKQVKMTGGLKTVLQGFNGMTVKRSKFEPHYKEYWGLSGGKYITITELE